jgi:hypothetical protein
MYDVFPECGELVRRLVAARQRRLHQDRLGYRIDKIDLPSQAAQIEPGTKPLYGVA